MLFTKGYVSNSRNAQSQLDEVSGARRGYKANEDAFAPILQQAGLQVNEGIIPLDVYQEFDNVTVQRIRSDDGDTFLNDLLPRARAINIGKMVFKHRKVSDAGNAQTSMSGQTGVNMDQVEYSYDGTIVPIHDIGFGRNFREMAAQSSEGFDALIDDQRESIATLRRKLVDSFMDGHIDRDGNSIVVDGLSWTGMRNDSRIAQINVGASGINFDFTDVTQSYASIEKAFKEVRNIMWITNNCGKDLTVYISREMASNFERQSSESYGSAKLIERLAGLMGIAGFKVSNKLVGNEFMGFPQDEMLRPLTGMAINTVAMPRVKYNDNHEFVSWCAVGWEARTDFENRKCAFFAQDLG